MSENTVHSSGGWFAALVAAALIAGTAGFFVGRGRSVPAEASTQPAEEPTPVVTVSTVPIRAGALRQTVIAYGPVTALPADVAIVSVPFESRVAKIVITPGQIVEKGTIVGEIGPSPDTQLQVRQAKAALLVGQKDLSQMQQRFDAHLATNTDLLTSQQNLEVAKLKLDAFTEASAGEVQPLKAPAAGIVSKIDVQAGQIVPAGASLVQIAAGNRIVARLGVEPQDVPGLLTGDNVRLFNVHDSSVPPVKGSIKMLTQRINADTRLVDVFVSFPPDSHLALDSFLRAELKGKAVRGLIVPRHSLVSGDNVVQVFTVADGKAKSHKVDVLAQSDIEAAVVGEGLADDDAIVVVAQHELEDGMSVTVQATATTGPTLSEGSTSATEPATESTTRVTTEP